MHVTFLLAALFLAPSFADEQVGEQSESVPARALDARRLRASFQDLYGRPPTRAERETWSEGDLVDLVDAALGGEAFWANWLEQELYYLLLIDNFRPTSERVLDLPAKLATKKIGVRDVLTLVGLCSSFDRRNPGPDTFVTVVLEQFRGANVQANPKNLEVGKKLYDGTPATFLGESGRTQADVVRIALGDRHALSHLLTRSHERLLRVAPERRDLAGWARKLEREPLAFADILREWFLSPAYDVRLETRRPLPNHAFVRALFVDLTDQPPTDKEVDRIRGAMDGLADAAPLRSVFARLVVDSGTALIPEKSTIEDSTKWVAGRFEHLLGRAATQAELRAFVEAFHEEACRPATIVLALVTHPDYSTW